MMKINFINNINTIRYGFLTTNPIKPRIRTLNSDVFEKSTEPSFRGRSCSTDDFKIKQLYDMPCPCCGQEMVTNAQLTSFVDNINNKTGENLVEILRRYDKYYRPVEKEVVDELVKYSIIYPEANIAELTKEISVLHRHKLVNEQTLVIDELKSMSNMVHKERRPAYEKYLSDMQKLVQDFDGEAPFKRKTFLSALETVCKDEVSPKNLEKIKSVAEKMPNSQNSTSAFFIKYARRGQFEIASRLLRQSLATAEHVVPRSRDGENNMSNFIAMCASCNSSRGSIPYDQWFKIHPEMPQNIQKYLDEVVRRIKKGQIKGYENYPFEIAETIKKESKEKAVPVVNDNVVVDDLFEDIPETLSLEDRLDVMQTKIDKKKAELAKLRAIAEKLKNDEEYQRLVLYYKLISEAETLGRAKQESLKRLNMAKQSQEAQERRIESLKTIEKDLAEPDISPRKRKKLEESLKKTKEKIQKHLIDVKEKEQAQKEYDKVVLALEEKRKEIVRLREELKHPEYYIEEENDLTGQLAQIYSTREEIASLRIEIAEKDNLSKRKTEVQTKIKELQHKLAVEDSIRGTNEQEEKDMLHKFDILVAKRDYLNSLKALDVKISVKPPRGIKTDFVIKDAKYAVQKQLEELKKEPVVQIKFIKEDIENLQEKKEEYNRKLAKIAESEKRLKELEIFISRCEEDGTEQRLIERLEEVRKQKNANKLRLENKAGYINIDKQIRVLEELIKVNMEELRRIKSTKKRKPE